jgi:flagellar hook-associated protein 3 FlgL
MRISDSMMTDDFLYDNNQIQQNLVKIQTQLSTNTKVQTLSDDVGLSLNGINWETQLSKSQTYSTNVGNGMDFINNSLSALSSMNTEVQNIISQATASNNALNSQNFSSIAGTIKNSLASIVQTMNTQYNGMYLFGGTNSKTPPITINTDGTASVTTTTDANGNTAAVDLSGEVKAQVSGTITTAINIPGSNIVATGLFDSINQIINSLQSGQTPDATAMTNLENSYQGLLNVQTSGGNIYNRLDNISQQLTTQQSNLQTMISNKLGVDPAKLSVDLQNQQYLLQMSDKILATSFSKSLLDYI